MLYLYRDVLHIKISDALGIDLCMTVLNVSTGPRSNCLVNMITCEVQYTMPVPFEMVKSLVIITNHHGRP